jgi:hypothetical protein
MLQPIGYSQLIFPTAKEIGGDSAITDVLNAFS